MEALIKKRSVVKGLLTRIEKYSLNLSDESCEEETKEKVNRSRVLLQNFADLEDQIFDLDSKEKSEREEFEEQYYRVISKLNKWLRRKSLSANNTSWNQTHDTTMNSSQSGAQSDFKLPSVNIPFFSGDYREWQSFYDLFNTMVHENQSLSAVRKFQYLKGQLKGEASNLLKHLPITEANYIEAFQKLCKRYDRRGIIANSYIRLFMDQPTIRQANAYNIRKLLDTSDEATRGLKALGAKAESRDTWLLYVLINKLDDEPKQLWTRQTSDQEFPSIQSFYEFLTSRADALEGASLTNKGYQSKPASSVKGFHVKTDVTCPVCSNNDHQLFECVKFKSMNIGERRDMIKTDGRCFNCLNNNHSVYNCRSTKRCRICSKRHHTLLHSEELSKKVSATSNVLSQENCETSKKQSQEQAQTVEIRKARQLQDSQNSNITTNHSQSAVNQTLLPTAVIKIRDKFGEWKLCRALLDSGSQVSFVSENLVHQLQLSRSNARICISGIGQTAAGTTRGKVTVSILSRFEPMKIEVECLIISKITSYQPATIIENHMFNKLENLSLADPSFNQSNKLDVLLGSDHFFRLMKEGIVHLSSSGLTAQNTVFGWVIAESMSNKNFNQPVNNINSLHCDLNVDHLLQKFWELEETSPSKTSPNYSEEEKCCEEVYNQTTTRLGDGRFVVKLPFKPSFTALSLGNTRYGALRRLEAMERKFQKDVQFRTSYVKFMEEYAELNHMEEVPADELDKANGVYYLPHHGVLRESSSTTKLRVVFDASFKSSNGASLNDWLVVGPTEYEPLTSILMRFRIYEFVFTADVEKMFRQIVLHPEHRDYHRILWRSDPKQPPKHYRLTTVTYGTASAPYLATRCLQEIGNSLLNKEPMIAKKILHDFYVRVDDFMSGCHTTAEAYEIQESITAYLKSYGFHLRKWSSNYTPLLKKIRPEDKENVPLNIEQGDAYIKLLGIQWNPIDDQFQFKVKLKSESVGTKREVLSQSARIFDPMGWLAPIVVTIKILFQSLWLLNLNWDDPLPTAEAREWRMIKEELPELERIRIPRWYGTKEDQFELHGFCDSSEKAYAAVVYCRCLDQNGQVRVTLMTSKTKVAPLNQISIPRLELCAAALLAKLIKSAKEALGDPDLKTTLWTDSTIVLGWLSAPPRRWKTFIANRTSVILTNTSIESWNHVDSQNNPADCASRGMIPSKLVGYQLWWHGPPWLSLSREHWPNQDVKLDKFELMKEERKAKTSVLTTIPLTSNIILRNLVDNISSGNKIIRVLAWIFKYLENLKSKSDSKNLSESVLTVNELKRSQTRIFTWIQKEYFITEISDIRSKRQQSKKSKIRCLNPFIDNQHLLRVGGRIENAAADYDTIHPIILPNCDFTKLMIRDLHGRHQHAGASLLTSIIRQRYHILNCRRLVKEVIQRCNRCRRFNTKSNYQLMGNLPIDRVRYEIPFLKIGVDYAGPLQLRQIYGRSNQRWKAYLAVFVCMATKAVHIEVVSNLTTANFIAALHRFVSRRGVCSDIYSDNGSNFIDANNELREISEFLKTHSNHILSVLASENITWHFIPSAAPTFGGLWEAAVKSFKYHLKRVMGNTVFTFEELSTIATQIEAVLNSRPLCVLSDDHMDTLTPGHLLIGRPINQIPQPQLSEVKMSHLSRWQLMQKMIQHFSNRWKMEYLASLHKRNKWQSPGESTKIGDVVLIREENLPPTKWLLGRIEEVHPGRDGTTRVVTIRTKTGNLKRPVNKLTKLATK